MKAVLHDDELARFTAEFAFDRVFLHLTIHQWNLNTIHTLRVRWTQTREMLRAAGYTRINAFFQKSNTSGPRFAEKLGFRRLRENSEFILMECENA